MIKKILVPLDGSELSEVTFKYARELAGRFKGLEVVLLHVCHVKHTVAAHRAYIESLTEKILHDAKNLMHNESVSVKGELIIGDPADEILRYVERSNIDLVLMATHGRSGISRWAMGSVAYKMIRSVGIPVLLVRAGIENAVLFDQLPERRLLVALDGTRSAEAIIPHVEAMASQWGKDNVQIILINVCAQPNVCSDYPSGVAESWETRIQQECLKNKLEAGLYLVDIEKRFKEAGYKVICETPFGKPSEEILRSAAKNRANLIAMVIHGRSGLRRWAYGDTAEEVMLEARTPILLVRP